MSADAQITLRPLPSDRVMYEAVKSRDSSFDGVFFTAVKTTGIFCRPTCPARKPHRENVEFFPSARDALSAGYRPCLRCRPLEPAGETPPWLERLLAAVDRDPVRRWTDSDLRALELDPRRVRRWFRAHHGMTFHAYHRARRLGIALGRIRQGDDLTHAAFDHGYESVSGFRDQFEKIFGRTPGSSRGQDAVTVTRLLSPLGPMVAGATREGICLLEFADRRMLETQIERLQARLRCAFVPGTHEHVETLDEQLNRYFEGSLREFDVPLVMPGTAFQRDVWKALLEIPYGETRSYEEIAVRVGRPKAVRAVGRANGDNRLAILVPCHRVVRADGSLCGYGGGLWRKRYLLNLEGGPSGA